MRQYQSGQVELDRKILPVRSQTAGSGGGGGGGRPQSLPPSTIAKCPRCEELLKEILATQTRESSGIRVMALGAIAATQELEASTKRSSKGFGAFEAELRSHAMLQGLDALEQVNERLGSDHAESEREQSPLAHSNFDLSRYHLLCHNQPKNPTKIIWKIPSPKFPVLLPHPTKHRARNQTSWQRKTHLALFPRHWILLI